jgi:hypothetical protein
MELFELIIVGTLFGRVRDFERVDRPAPIALQMSGKRINLE